MLGGSDLPRWPRKTAGPSTLEIPQGCRETRLLQFQLLGEWGESMGCPTDFENGPVFTPWCKQYTPYIWVKYFVKLILLLQSHPIYIIFTPWVNWWLKYTQWYIGQSTTFFLDVNHPVVLSLQDFYRIPTRRFDWTTDIGVPNPKSETSRSALLVTKMPVISISLDSPPVSFNGCIVNPRSVVGKISLLIANPAVVALFLLVTSKIY